MSEPVPTVGRIVLVKNPKFLLEFPAIVVRAYRGVSEYHVDIQVFTNDDDGIVFLGGVGPQSDSLSGWGWRWPPRVSEPAFGATPAPSAPASTLSQEEPLARV